MKNLIPEIDEEAEGEIVNLINVQADVLRKVLEYCKHYAHEKMTPIETPLRSTRVKDLVQDWYADFCDSMDDQMLFRLVTAADYMNIQPIIDLTCLKVAVLMKGKSPDEVKRMFPSHPHPDPPVAVGESPTRDRDAAVGRPGKSLWAEENNERRKK